MAVHGLIQTLFGFGFILLDMDAGHMVKANYARNGNNYFQVILFKGKLAINIHQMV